MKVTLRIFLIQNGRIFRITPCWIGCTFQNFQPYRYGEEKASLDMCFPMITPPYIYMYAIAGHRSLRKTAEMSTFVKAVSPKSSLVIRSRWISWFWISTLCGLLMDYCRTYHFWILFGEEHSRYTLQGTNISHQKSLLKMIFLFPRWDMLIPWRVVVACWYLKWGSGVWQGWYSSITLSRDRFLRRVKDADHKGSGMLICYVSLRNICTYLTSETTGAINRAENVVFWSPKLRPQLTIIFQHRR